MYFKKLIYRFGIVFIITFLVNIGVYLIWNWIFYRVVIFECKISFRFALILGIILSINDLVDKNRYEK